MASSVPDTPQLRAIVQHDPEAGHVVQCIDYDIAAYAPTVDEAIEAFKRRFIGTVAVGHQLGIEPLSDLPEAPAEARDAWRASFFRRDAVRRFTIPGFQVGSETDRPYRVPPTAVEVALPPTTSTAGESARAALG